MKIQGLAGSPGCEVGIAVVYQPKELSLAKVLVSDADAEVRAMEEAKERYYDSLGEMVKNSPPEQAAIFEAYQEMLEDDSFFGDIADLIRAESCCASYAIDTKRAEIAEMFLSLDDEYLRARGDDINNVCRELMAEIQGISNTNPFAGIEGDRLIIFGEDLTPADTVRMDRDKLCGMVTESGGITSHTVILAKARGIPAVVGCGKMLDKVKSGQKVLVDGATGCVIVDPDAETEAEFLRTKEEADRQKALYDACKDKPAVSLDGREVRVNVNSGDRESMERFEVNNCDGVGLFRTEFVYMSTTDYPTEDAQFQVYKEMAEKTAGKELIIRTLDIGGDKQLDYMHIPKENNPFLGYRAIRLCLDRIEVFRTQLRAILRAANFGNVKIMFPMIVGLEEIRKAKQILAESKQELIERGETVRDDIPVGIMVETPAAALLSDILAKEVDFFSIGSNDLIQYVTASDRQNESVQYIYDCCNVSVLRAVRMTAEAAHKEGIEVGICGETASEPRLIPLWLAMGIDELSVAPGLVGRTKYLISKLNRAEMQKVLDDVLGQGEIEKVKERLDQILAEISK